MNSRLQFLTDKVMEAAWLAALVLIPLFFNRTSSRIFDADKITLVRSLALIAGVAWILKIIDIYHRRIRARSSAASELILWRRPLVLPLLALASVYLLSTIFSIAPGISWQGSYIRMEGTYSTFSYLLFLLVVLSAMRTLAQWRRFQYALILTSFAVSLYGILQHFDCDPLSWGPGFSNRVFASLGNPIFLGGYLILAAPLTAERLVSEMRSLLLDGRNRVGMISAASILLVLVSQIAALIFAGSRGPWLGLSAGAYVAGLLFLVRFRHDSKPRSREILLGLATGVLGLLISCLGVLGYLHFSRGAGTLVLMLALVLVSALYLVPLLRGHGEWLWLSWFSQAALSALLLIVLISHPPARAMFQNMPGVGELISAGQARGGTVRVRALIWQGVIDLISQSKPITLTGGWRDAIGGIRRLIGYGPETMYLISDQFYKPELASLQARSGYWDRAHNDVYDCLVTTGVLGVVASLALFVGIFYYALRWLRLIESPRDRLLFWLVVFAVVLISVVTPWFLGVPYLAGGVLGPALAASICIYAVFSGFRGVPSGGKIGGRDTVLLALLAAIVAHLVEIGFGMATGVTRIHFYLFTGILILIGTRNLPVLANEEADNRGLNNTPAPSAETRGKKGSRSSISVRPAPTPAWRRQLPHAILISLILVAIDWDFMSNAAGENSALTIFWRAWTEYAKGSVQSAAGPLAICILLLVVSVSVVLAARDTISSVAHRTKARNGLLIFIGLAVCAWFAYGLFQADRLILPSDLHSTQEVTSYLSAPFNGFTIWAGVFLVFLAASLWSCDYLPDARSAPLPASAVILGVFALAGSVAFIDRVNLEPVRADIYYKSAVEAKGAFDMQQSLFYLNTATEAAPNQDHYLDFLSQALVQSAFNSKDQLQRASFLDRAENVIKRSLEISPLDTVHIRNLAAYYVTRAEHESDPATRLALLRQAIPYCESAARLSPTKSDVYKDWGRAYFLLGEYDEARKMYQKSLELDPKNDAAYVLAGELEFTQGNPGAALQALTKASQINPENVGAQTSRVMLLKRLGLYNEDVASNLDAWAAKVNDPMQLNQLSTMYSEVGDLRRALSYAQRAYILLPQEQQSSYYPVIQKLQDRLVNRK